MDPIHVDFTKGFPGKKGGSDEKDALSHSYRNNPCKPACVQSRRRMKKTGEHAMFSGLSFCGYLLKSGSSSPSLRSKAQRIFHSLVKSSR